jgi:type II secretory pathway pseudopilin PulG
MTGRDRIVVIAIAVLAVLGAGWLLVVSPERKKAEKVASQVSEAQSQLQTAEGQLDNARQAQAQYDAAYTSIVELGKAVPPSEEVSSLIYQLQLASSEKDVNFTSIASGGGGAAAGPGSSSTATATVAPTAFTQMPFTFVFNGTYFALDHLFANLDRLTQRSASGALEVNGRLLTIQSVKLAPASGSLGGARTSEDLTGTITASAYVLPASQGLTGGAAPATGASPASGGGSSSSPTTPAIVRANP